MRKKANYGRSAKESAQACAIIAFALFKRFVVQTLMFSGPFDLFCERLGLSFVNITD